MNEQEKEALKKKLLEHCLIEQNNRVNTAREAMENIQESANEEEGGTEEKFEGFRSQLQIDRDMFAKQYSDAVEGLNVLRKIELDRVLDTPALGAVVVTSAQNLFVSVNIGQIKLDGKVWFGVSMESPLFKAMVGKKQGESFVFRDKNIELTEIF